MPVLDGIAATRKIRKFLTDSLKIEKEEQPKIFGITAHFHKSYIEEGKRAGMDDVFSKPLVYSVLV